jgi:hypothetical protein
VHESSEVVRPLITEGLEIKAMVVIFRSLLFPGMNLASREPGSWNVRGRARIDRAPLGTADIVQVDCVDWFVSLSVVEAEKMKP